MTSQRAEGEVVEGSGITTVLDNSGRVRGNFLQPPILDPGRIVGIRPTRDVTPAEIQAFQRDGVVKLEGILSSGTLRGGGWADPPQFSVSSFGCLGFFLIACSAEKETEPLFLPILDGNALSFGLVSWFNLHLLLLFLFKFGKKQK